MWLQPSCGRTAARVCYAAGKESGSTDSTTITEAGDRGKCRGLTGFWCTDGYAVCGYAEAAATSKDIVVSVDDVGVSKTPGLRVTHHHRLIAAALTRGDRCFSNRILSSFQFSGGATAVLAVS